MRMQLLEMENMDTKLWCWRAPGAKTEIIIKPVKDCCVGNICLSFGRW